MERVKAQRSAALLLGALILACSSQSGPSELADDADHGRNTPPPATATLVPNPTPAGLPTVSGSDVPEARPAEQIPLELRSPTGSPLRIDDLFAALEGDGLSLAQLDVPLTVCDTALAGVNDVVKLGGFRAASGDSAQDFIVWVYAGVGFMEEAWEVNGEVAIPLDPWRCSASVAESVPTIYAARNLLLAFSQTTYGGVGLAQDAELRTTILNAFQSLR